jgi:hypothetical protein
MTQSTPRIGALQIVIILLVVATAIVHLQLNFPDVMFILNGLGYLTLLGALYLPLPQLASYRSTIRWALVAFTAVTILGWLAIGSRNLLAYTDKTIEVSLLVLLVMEARQP